MSDFIRERRATLLSAWEEAVRQLPALHRLSQPRVLDHIPLLLDRIAEVLDGEAPASGEPAGLPETHALQRLDEGVDLGQVAREYGLLRRCVLELYAREGGAAVPVAEVLRFNQAVDEAIILSVERFTQARARTLIGLDRISTAALESGDVASFLPRLLRVLMETTASVDEATILLREGDRLKVRASAGLLESREDGFSLAVGEGFSGTIAKTREPLLLRSAATEPLVKSDAIRAVGLRALYGVPLMWRDEVIGVAHMGSRTAYDFSEEDMLLFRTMVNRASALIAQAELVDEVRRRAVEREALLEREQAARTEAERSLALVDAFFSTSPLGMAFLDPQLRYVRINEGLAALNGKPAQAHLGRTVREMLPEDAVRLEPLLHRVMETGEPQLNLEIPGRSASAAESTFLANYFPVRARDGALLGIGGTVLNITERKRTQAALDEQRLLYQSLLKAQSDLGEGVALIEGARLIYANEALCRMLECSPEALYEADFRDALIAPDHRDVRTSRLAQRAAGGGPEHYESAAVLKSGRRVELELSLLPMEHGRSLAVCRDITERKAAEAERERLLAEVQAGRTQLASVLESMPLGVVVAEAPSGRILLGNHLVERIMGAPAQLGLEAGHYREWCGLHPDGRPYAPHEYPLARAVRGETVLSEEMDYVRADGTRRAVSASAAPIRDATGAVTGAVVAFEDVTERKRAREELAQSLLFREQVIGILGHDLRTPLSAIRTAAALLLRRGPLPEVAARSVRRIDHAAERMAEMIAALLDFTEARFKGTLSVARASGDLHAVVRETFAELELANPTRTLRLHEEGDGRGLWDAGRLSQVVSNLVSNALSHGEPTAPVDVWVRGDGPEVVLAVRNQGSPIPPELLPTLFAPFRQGAPSGPRGERRGVGLGLFIVQEIVKAHGGHIEVTSSAAEGTTFTVRLPRAPRLVEPDAQA